MNPVRRPWRSWTNAQLGWWTLACALAFLMLVFLAAHVSAAAARIIIGAAVALWAWYFFVVLIPTRTRLNRERRA
jgi:hypothetical protein